MRTPELLVSLLAAVSARREQGGVPLSHDVQRRHSGGFVPIPGYPGHHHGNGYPGGGSQVPVYPGPVYPNPPPYPGHHGGPYPPPVPHTSVHIEPEKIVLNCVVQGYASTPIQWLKPDGPGLVAEGGAVLWDRRHILVESDVFGGGRRSRLVLSYPQPRHLGVYQCQAGSAASRAFRVGGDEFGSGGFQPVFHARSGGSGQILAAREPGSDPELEPEERGKSEPLTEAEEREKQEIIETIKREIEDVENAVRSARSL
ncbi:uncharacterized protein LOC122370134 [Amphibalanus amphitrite]|uniref:uncharacterized protein LOC122370134 n=1 Tax=Amphibalanus amphitrite TaxID=1232801 RepID=UPI001C923627|nr:uncharacterized protein LOC122370134 [Amphibalanus amphitrite]